MKPKFYCENCKNEVSSHAKVCPHCGRFFSEVRCPRCGFTGEGKLFFDGCPNCGYLSAGSRENAFPGGGLEFVDIPQSEHPSRSDSKKSLSLWTFLVITIALAGVLAMLLYVFLSLA